MNDDDLNAALIALLALDELAKREEDEKKQTADDATTEKTPSNVEEEKWYYSPVIITICGTFLQPLGIFLAWKSPHNILVKLFCTFIFGWIFYGVHIAHRL